MIGVGVCVYIWMCVDGWVGWWVGGVIMSKLKSVLFFLSEQLRVRFVNSMCEPLYK